MIKAIEKSPGIWISAILVLLTLAVYGQTLGHDFINFDDPRYITENPNVQAGLSWSAVKWAFTTDRESNWHPLTWLSHIVDWQIYGDRAWGHHLTNLLLHLASTVLLFIVLFRMTGFAWRSAFVAALFGVHPLHVESVAWLAERKDVLSAFFWMLTMLAYVSYVRKPRVTSYLLVIAAFALGLLSKPMLVSLPLVLLLLDYWPLGRFGSVTAWKLLAEKAPMLLMTAGSSVITYIAQKQGGAVGRMDVFSPGIRAANAVVAYVTYVVKMVWPANLTIFYRHPGRTLPSWQVIGAALLMAAATAGALYLRRKRPYVTTGWLWFVVTLVPVIGLVQVGSQAWADRYSYIPLIGLFMLISWWVPDLLAVRQTVATRESGKRKKRALMSDSPAVSAQGNPLLIAAACAVVLALTIVGVVQASYWRNSETLWTHAIDVTADEPLVKQNPLAEKMLGQVLEEEHDYEGAREHYQKAVDIKPAFIEARNSLALTLEKTGRKDEAIDQYEEALKLKPSTYNDTAIVHNNLARALAGQKRYREAIPHYEAALRSFPNNASMHSNLGVALAMEGKLDEAGAEVKKALRIAPGNATAHADMGFVLVRYHLLDDAIKEFRETVRLDPNYDEAYNNLAAAYFAKGDYAEAWRQMHEYEQHGGRPRRVFLQALTSAMPEPAHP